MDNSRQIVLKAAILTVLILGLTFFLKQIVIDKQIQMVPLDTQWQIRVNDQQYDGDRLEEITFPMTQKGDHVEITGVLPDLKITQPSLQINFRQSEIHIYVGEKEIYSYGMQYAKRGVMLGAGYIWQELPADYAGKVLRVTLDVQENDAFNKFLTIYAQETSHIYYNMFSNQILTVVIIGFLLCFGYTSLVIVVCMYTRKNAYRGMLSGLMWIAVFALLVATWLLTYSRMIEIWIDDFRVIGLIEYISLYFAPISMLFFMYDMMQDGWYRKVIKLMGILFVVCDVVMIFLDVSGIAHFARTLKLLHLMIGLNGIVAVYLALRWAKKRKRRADWIFAGSILLFIGFAIADLIRYALDKYGNTGWQLSATVMPVGLLVFVIGMFMSFVFMMMENVADNMERKTLLQMAYTDALTNISNRAKCEEIFAGYEESQDPLTIVLMDLNHFKQVNDTYGHAAGDELLIRFAGILKEQFDGVATAGRMGGDEFVLILDYHPKEEMERLMDQLLARVEKANASAGRPYEISVAYGYADNYNNREFTNVWKVYEEADRNMYEYKKRYNLGR